MVDMMGKSAPAFLVKTYMVVEDPATDAIISWNPDGTAFVVWHPPEFARDHLPTIFKHCNFSSFVRQLNTYGFRKVATNRWEFSNDLFRKDKKDQLCKIRRRKSMPSNKPKHNVQVSIVDDEDERSLSTSSSSELTILIDENTRLKQENNILNSELAAMKNKCNELVELVYGGDDSEKEEQCVQMDEDDDNGVLKLFGVRMKVGGEREIKKRKRVEARENARVLLFQSCK